MSNQRKDTLIIGSLGQVGRAMYFALKSNYKILRHDLQKRMNPRTDEMVDSTIPPEEAQGLVMNICIPFSDNFSIIIKEYFKTYNPSLVLIHSTVPVGTTESLVDDGIPIVHSPTIFDDNRFDSILAFRKMIGYDKPELALMAEEYFRPCINTGLITGSRNTELADACLGLYFATCRAVTFEMAKMFRMHNLDYRFMMELINYNNVGYSYINKGAKFLQNLLPDLNKDDYRYNLIDLLDDSMTSAFFKLTKRSYDIEQKKRQERYERRKEAETEKVS